MSYAISVTLISYNAAATVNIVGAAAAATGGLVLTATGLLALEGLRALAEVARGVSADIPVGATAPVQYQAFSSDLRAEALPVVSAELARHGLRDEQRDLMLGDGSLAHVVMAMDEQGQAIFMIRAKEDGRLEFIAKDAENLKRAEPILLDTVRRLAEGKLRRPAGAATDRVVAGDLAAGLWKLHGDNSDGSHDEIVFRYASGRLRYNAVRRARDGRLLYGKDCPNAESFTAFFASPSRSALALQDQPGPAAPGPSSEAPATAATETVSEPDARRDDAKGR